MKKTRDEVLSTSVPIFPPPAEPLIAVLEAETFAVENSIRTFGS